MPLNYSKKSEFKTLQGAVGFKHGLWAESIAAIMLMLKGYGIIEKRYKSRHGEVDIIAIKHKTLIVVEVKKRKTLEAGKYAILPNQQARLQRGITDFIARHSKFNDFSVRFDAIIVAPFKLPLHITDAWRP